ncbi:cystathionine gamma-synthase [Candidatus Daviesbacteria bacterium RIFCSPLOWO2_01_FULL_38_10]|uniref:Cystathionine gamma-lyase n=1 Tax=Candidatus Daviesbacteria bacterium GW2011_GWF2_38_6 TaxID=1618432 RepID=A0A0G0KBA4_9BACT|nr:MAG: Cystathionine gamma-lyase [Candidatus Daviesbacteria bacterium GW2011_GWA2_38_17]KKQ76948.1 MAG: Cystathionine gamma-lyase [Candidatus Daviesbacteria bacterium GW2011_GWF2_38_6]OGE27090.1 MAG: cystathionine gamma-synthase [Candidatus Daviesbacteria bacterium RIFCSPHIGHO2_02_FULL_39_41]OGE38007.1 MAG: cystathionine gamma-synthase [Candidatus Daviesbacteria bacterium RIFCSPLOWO2_01_FULL_38_10]OGE45662.1 MAG: cystathionine gamma-synthase [Candidatus Daviesbacteria bacterium RIFCSPHIGHO2_12
MSKFATKAIHIGSEPNLEIGGSGDVVVPIHLSTTFARTNVYKPIGGYEYSRTGNPTRHALEKNLAVLENGKFAFAFSSGLSAITNTLLLLQNNDHSISIDDVYGGTRRLFTKVFKRFGLQFSFVNFTKGKDIVSHVKPNTKMVWIESPTNPLMKIVDIASVCKTAKKKNVLTVVDNTFASPYFQKPLDLGADIVIHSLTKYIGGHSDVVGGCVVVKDKALAERIGFLQNAVGGILSPFDSYSVLRGIKTLEIRMQKHDENAKKIAAFLSKHKKIKKIYYPGFGGMLSFELQGNKQTTINFMEALKIIVIAESLGAVESLIDHPASMTHASVPKEARETIGLSDKLIRLSVGIEDPEDLIIDLSQALSKI